MFRLATASITGLLLTALTATHALATPEVYGRANVSLQFEEEGDASTTELRSNNSRLGVRGSEKIDEGLEVIYQAEYRINVDGDGEAFDARNVFVGLRGSAGELIAGRHDTPLKSIQNKVDLFNDLVGDIGRFITRNDNRVSNLVMYKSPKSLPVGVRVAFVASEEDGVDNGISASASWEQDGLYLALGVDSNVEAEGVDVLRFVAQYKLDALQLGVLYEDQDGEDAGLADADGVTVSAAYKVGKKTTLKLQVGQSDIIEEGGEAIDLGLDYKLSDSTKLFSFVTSHEGDEGTDNQYLGFGIQHNF